MKTKANTLIEDGQDIKVKNIATENLFIKDYNISINKDDDGYINIENQNEGIVLRDGDGNYLLIDEDGFRFTTDIYDHLILTGYGADFSVPIIFSKYTTALRPTSVSEGTVIYDSTLKKCILYNGTAWVNLDGTALE